LAVLRNSVRTLERDLLAFEDIKQVKLWLKQVRREAAMNPFDDMPY
jgi:hypothetical protein